MESRCTWCGNVVDPGDCYALAEHAGDRGAVFCRLEHIVPWAIQGAHWEAGEPVLGGRSSQNHVIGENGAPTACSQCGAALDEAALLLVRRRSEHRIEDGFCGVDHLLEWSKQGGRWRS